MLRARNSSRAFAARSKISWGTISPRIVLASASEPGIDIYAIGPHGGNDRGPQQIEGTFEATSIRLSGVVRDDTVLRAKTLEVRLSAEEGLTVAFGRTRLEVGEPLPHGSDPPGKRRGGG